MTFEEAKTAFENYERENVALNHATGLIYYDGSTIAPKESIKVREISLGELSRMQYELTTSEKTVEMLETMKANSESLDNITKRKISELYREYERTKRIPADEFVAWQTLMVKADAVWHEAKEKNDFALFEPYLQDMFDTAKKIALYIEPDKKPYDTMLDMYERGLTTEKCEEFFGELKNKLVPLIKKVTSSENQVDVSPISQNFPIDKQRNFSSYIMDIMGIDKNRCIIGETEHPFTTDFTKYDVRITTHYHEDMVVSSMYSVIHEGGHALYELGVGDGIAFSCLGSGVSMAIHESQSRFYENIIGRSKEFCELIFPWVQKNFAPLLDNVSCYDFYRMVNKSEPSLIRTEADELTYALHIMVRYELEKAMLDGKIKAKDLPKEWNRLYKEYLGVDVPSDREGVLQDSHWSNCNIGYFPSYAIGSAYGAQYLTEMNKEFDVFGEVKKGNIKKINDWFANKIWVHGCMFDPDKLFESVCGKFKPDVFVKYLEDKFTEVYKLNS